MSLLTAWKRFIYFILSIIILVVILVLFFTIGIFVLIFVTVIAIIGLIIRFLFFRRKKTVVNEQNAAKEPKIKITGQVIDAEIVEEENKHNKEKEESK